jgi:hypothetical protein
MGEPVGVTHLRALIAVLLLALALPLAAHEIGTTRVHATFLRDHTYRIDVFTSARALKRRLGDAAEIQFGSVRAHPRAVYGADTIRLTGEVPPNAGPFRWRYLLSYATYSLTVETPGRAPVTLWLEGDAVSPPVELAHPSVLRQYLVLGFTHIVPKGLDHILFVLACSCSACAPSPCCCRSRPSPWRIRSRWPCRSTEWSPYRLKSWSR